MQSTLAVSDQGFWSELTIDVGGGGCWREAFRATSTFTDRPFLALAFGVLPESGSTAGVLTGVATGFPPQTCFWI